MGYRDETAAEQTERWAASAARTRARTLTSWVTRQKRSAQLYARAETPLQETVGMFRPGGGYGAGQVQLAEDQARKEKAEALTTQVASGMSSGSLATATGLRVGRDLTTAKLGIEDVRTQFLAQALQALGGLRGTQAQQVGATVNPTYAPYMSALAGWGTSPAASMRQQQPQQQQQQGRYVEMQF